MRVDSFPFLGVTFRWNYSGARAESASYMLWCCGAVRYCTSILAVHQSCACAKLRLTMVLSISTRRKKVGLTSIDAKSIEAQAARPQLTIAMESAPAKRRKIDHTQGTSVNVLQTAAAGGLPRSRAFLLEVEELLDEVGLDYATAFAGADELLHKIKTSIERIEEHEPIQVFHPHLPENVLSLTCLDH